MTVRQSSWTRCPVPGRSAAVARWRGDGGLCAREYLCWAGIVERGVRASAKAENTCPSSWSCRLTVRTKATTLHPTRSSALPRVSGDEQRRTSHTHSSAPPRLGGKSAMSSACAYAD
jgi:hypothetical protein